MRDLLPIFGISLFMWLCIFICVTLIENCYVQLLFGVFIGFLLFAVLSKLFLKSEWKDLMSIIKFKEVFYDKSKRNNFKLYIYRIKYSF